MLCSNANGRLRPHCNRKRHSTAPRHLLRVSSYSHHYNPRSPNEMPHTGCRRAWQFHTHPLSHPPIENPRTSSHTGHTKNPQHCVSRKRKAPDLDPHLALTCVTCSLFRPPYESGTGKEEVEQGPTPQQVSFTFASIELLRQEDPLLPTTTSWEHTSNHGHILLTLTSTDVHLPFPLLALQYGEALIRS